MKYVLFNGEEYRRADGEWTPDPDHAERFSHDAAAVRRDELVAAGIDARIVETHGRSRKASAAMVGRITKNLDTLERSWRGKTIGIGYDVDVEAGRVNLIIQPEDEPENALEVAVDIASIMVGRGDAN